MRQKYKNLLCVMTQMTPRVYQKKCVRCTFSFISGRSACICWISFSALSAGSTNCEGSGRYIFSYFFIAKSTHSIKQNFSLEQDFQFHSLSTQPFYNTLQHCSKFDSLVNSTVYIFFKVQHLK